MPVSPGRALVSSILKGDINQLHHLGIKEEFLQEDEKDALNYLTEHVYKFGVIPNLETLQEHVDTFVPVVVSEPAEYYIDQLKNRYFYRTMNTAMKQARAEMQVLNPTDNMLAPMDLLSEAMLALKFIEHERDLFDFRDAYSVIKAAYVEASKGGHENSITLGWDTIDVMSGGLVPGDVVSYIGRPGLGKTWSILHSMHHAWWNEGKTALLLSMEMIPKIIMQRMTAMHTHTGLTALKSAELTTKTKNKVFNEMKAIKGHDKPCWIVDGNLTATVDDLKILCAQLKPDVVFVDGAYMLSPSIGYHSKWDKVTNTVEEIKRDIATNLGTVSVLSYQFNREAAKKAKKAADDIGLEDIGLSDAIGQISTLVLALLDNESIQTEVKRKMTIMKGRNGERGEFFMNWCFKTMDFSEILPEDMQSNLSFL